MSTSRAGTRRMLSDGPVFASIESLAAASDLIVLATVKGVNSRQTDFGGQNGDDGGGGLPLVFYEVVVTEGVAGSVDQGESVLVAVVDTTVVRPEGAVELAEGDEALFYLRAETPATAPGIEFSAFGSDFDTFYILLNDSNGVLRVSGDKLIPSGDYPLAMTDSEARSIEDARAEELEVDDSGGEFSDFEPTTFDLDATVSASR